MYLLYELSIISVRMIEKRRAAALAAQEAELNASSSEQAFPPEGEAAAAMPPALGLTG